jgi:hapalindole-type alkaloid chlorinase
MSSAPSRATFEPTTHAGFSGGLLDVDAADLAPHAGLVAAIFDDRILGAVVRGVFDPAAIDALRRDIGSGAVDLPLVRSEHYGGASYGEMLIVSPGDLSSYFASAARMRGLVAGTAHVESRLVEVFGVLSGGLPIVLAEGPDGAPYSPVTIRVVEPGGSIAVHCENETVRFPAMAHLATAIDTRDQLSFYTPLALPEAGGELHVYPLRHGEPSGATFNRSPRSFAEIGEALSTLSPVIPALGLGDLLLFDAGRYYHGVTPVRGARERWTMGGFLGRVASGQRILFWS